MVMSGRSFNLTTFFLGGRGLVDRKLVQAPSNFIAGRPKAALLFGFFGDFRCGALLFMIILIINKFINR